MNVLVTGAAGFIGSHLCHRLVKEGHDVSGVDCIHDLPYGTDIKLDRLDKLPEGIDFKTHDVLYAARWLQKDIDVVVHLAALAGVRCSMQKPLEYIQNNIAGTTALLEACRNSPAIKFIYASSSSVYGGAESGACHEEMRLDRPVSLYAATKKACELVAYSYSELYRMHTVGLRFFTVYGPWGRPDMALFKFARNILDGKPIDVYNNGHMSRDFTYVDDIVEGIMCCVNQLWHGSSQIYNIGRGEPQELFDFIKCIERHCGREAIKNMLPMQLGDVMSSHADTTKLQSLGYKPRVSIDEGVRKTIEWFKGYY